MPKAKQLSRRERTAAVIDVRVYDLMLKLLENPDLTTSEILGYIRAAYAQGYTDCLKDPEHKRGQWIKELGYGVEGVDL